MKILTAMENVPINSSVVFLKAWVDGCVGNARKFGMEKFQHMEWLPCA
jgi:hypothetical protein